MAREQNAERRDFYELLWHTGAAQSDGACPLTLSRVPAVAGWLEDELCADEIEWSMTDDLIEATLATWAARGLPARLDVLATAKLLGC